MSLHAQIQALRTKRAAAVDGADKILTKCYEEKRSMNAEEEQEFDRRHTEAATIKSDIDRHEKQISVRADLDAVVSDLRTGGRENTTFTGEETRAGGNGNGGGKKTLTPELRTKYESLDFRYRLGGDQWTPFDVKRELQEFRTTYGPLRVDPFTMSEEEQRALSATTNPSTAATGTAGASTVPQGFVQKLEIALKYFGGILDAADYLDTDNGAPLVYPTINDTSNLGEQTSENSVVAGADVSGGSGESDPSYGVLTFNAFMQDSGFVRVPIQLLQDSAFDVEQYLVDQLKIRIGRKLTALCTTGAGSTEPKGIVTAATQGIVPTGGDTVSYSYDDLVGLYHSVDPAYRDGAKVGWMMSDTALLAARKIKDKNDRPMLIAGGTAEGIQNGAPETLLGKRYWINQSVAVPAASAKSLLFGDFSKYKIRRVRQIGIARADQLFLAQLQVGFLAYQRFDGNLVDAGTHPVKYLQHPAS